MAFRQSNATAIETGQSKTHKYAGWGEGPQANTNGQSNQPGPTVRQVCQEAGAKYRQEMWRFACTQ
jgi:hypothetical protein